MQIDFPDGAQLEMPCVINVTECGGDATAIGALSFDCVSDGRPAYNG